ncbi:MAG: tRNA lysidine(34) synthetase TilS, partial [Deltaproteobacteria bacterium]|nr:tRNA lysidine(34) synthetase TilS [Deltaproteobacteria bacterium]
MLADKVKNTIEQYHMLKHGDRVVVAVSGGVDSAALLDMLLRLKNDYSLELIVAHLNHNLRGKDSRSDLFFVKSLSEKYGLEFIAKTLNKGTLKAKGQSLQAEARRARYRFFETVIGQTGADKVATAHTADDQAETVLMRLIKGAGARGLSGIPAKRGHYIRPLIEVTRAELERHIKENHLSFVLDKSNSDRRYLRNSIRLDLIPYIEKHYNPNIKEALSRSAILIARDEGHLRREAQRAFTDVMVDRTRDDMVLDRKKLISLDEAICARIFLLGLNVLGVDTEGFYNPHFETFLKLLKGKRPNASFNLPCGVRIVREYERIVLTLKEKTAQKKTVEKILVVPGMTEAPELASLFKTSVLRKKPSLNNRDKQVAYLDMDSLEKPLIVRTFRPGDRIAPLGMKGRKKVKEIFIEKK